jgi:hypothetical protein
VAIRRCSRSVFTGDNAWLDAAVTPALDAFDSVVVRNGRVEGKAKHVRLSSHVTELPDRPPEVASQVSLPDPGWRGRLHWSVWVENERHARGIVYDALDGTHIETTRH